MNLFPIKKINLSDKSMKILTILLIVFLVTGCISNPKNDSVGNNEKFLDSLTIDLNRVSEEESIYQCNYLNETPPDSILILFTEGIVSTNVGESSFEINSQ